MTNPLNLSTWESIGIGVACTLVAYVTILLIQGVKLRVFYCRFFGLLIGAKAAFIMLTDKNPVIMSLTLEGEWRTAVGGMLAVYAAVLLAAVPVEKKPPVL